MNEAQSQASSESNFADISSTEFSACKAKGTWAIASQLAIEFTNSRAVYCKNTNCYLQFIDNRFFFLFFFY